MLLISSYIKAIEYYLPDIKEFNNAEDRLTKKIGIFSKHIAANDEFASDLGVKAAEKLFDNGIDKSDVDFILYCTQSPDYFLPTTACILQERLGLPRTSGAMDFNLGCSGFVYGLSLAKGLIESGQATNILLITSETYSKFIHPKDKSVQPLFGDAAAATLISRKESEKSCIQSFVFGTDGRGSENLIVTAGGMRQPITSNTSLEIEDELGNIRSQNNLFMNGIEIFKFAMKEVPLAVNKLLEKENTTLEDYDHFVFHQANYYMLESLRSNMKIPKDKFVVNLGDCGNTVSSTIPIALKREVLSGKIKHGDRIILVGFGVGYSWSACSIHWQEQ
jgi:3-oxoacyl-[acyl-carrier-protein] synthase-3